MRHRIIDTFTGPFALIQHDDGQLATTWLSMAIGGLLDSSRLDRQLMPDLVQRLRSYFDGDDVNFSDVESPRGGEFFVRCWSACRAIRRGETRSYAELAHAAGSPAGAARAAGQAMRNNPLPIIIPCHRVIGSNGRLHGFGGALNASGQELVIKRQLLRMEGAPIDALQSAALVAAV